MNVVASEDIPALLCEFTRNGCESAYAELVRRHINLVYSTALRRCHGDTALAEDVTQQVFLDLAKKAKTLSPDTVLAGWLHCHTSFVAANYLRSEQRRKQREQVFMEACHDNAPVDWSAVAPLLEEAIDELTPRDRDAVVLRFLDQQPYAQIGTALGISEDAARMRVDRALDRLRGLLARRGARSTVAALALALGQQATISAPAGLAASVAAHAISGASVTTMLAAAGSATTTGLMSTKLFVSAAGLIAAGAVTTAILQASARQDAEGQLRVLQNELAAMTQDLQSAQANAAATEADAEQWRAARAEIAELRDKSANLQELQEELERLQLANLELQQALENALRPKEGESPEEISRQHKEQITHALGTARMIYLKDWMAALRDYAEEEGGGVIPSSLAEAEKYFPTNRTPTTVPFDRDRFEIVYHGRLDELENPSRTIVIREKEPFRNVPQPGEPPRFLRTYAFADGHAEIHASPTEDATEWERERMVAPRQP
jgi:RNA polymerase sigma factor (sigma-70 family)